MNGKKIINVKNIILVYMVISIILLAFIAIILNMETARQKHVEANAITNDVRYSLVVGDMREVRIKLQDKINKDFDYIKYKNNFSQESQEYKPSDDKFKFSTASHWGIKNSVYLDSNKKNELGVLVFYYSMWENIDIIFYAWIVVSLLLIPIMFFVRILLQRKLEVEYDVQKNAAIANITRTIVHDIRNPLGTVEFVMKAESWEHFLKLKPRLLESYLKINAMLENIRYGQVEFIVKQFPRELNFVNTINETRIYARIKNVKLNYYPYKTKITVSVDMPLLERAVVNILRNAIESGAKNVSLTELIDEHSLTLKVANDGCEIPQEIIPNLFTKGGTFGKQGGTGLGLYFVKNVINGHGGSVKYTRESNETVFTIHIPKVIFELVKKDIIAPNLLIDSVESSSLVKLKEANDLVLIVIADKIKSKNIVDRINNASENIEHLEKASVLYTDETELLSKAMTLGIFGIMAMPKDDDDIVVKKIKRKLLIN